MNTQPNSRRNAMRGLLKNTATAKILSDALESPLGSTKRLQAQKILSIVHRTSSVPDGVGGLAPIPKKDMAINRQSQDYSNFVVFHAAPPRRDHSKKIDGQGGSEPGSPLVPSLAGLNVNPLAKYQNNAWTTPTLGSQASSLPSFVAPVAPVIAPDAAPAAQESTASPLLKNLSIGLNNGTIKTQEQANALNPNSSTIPEMQNETQTSTAPTSVQSAVNSGVGPSMFAFGALAQGKDYLKTLPGFDKLPDSYLTGAPTLAARQKETEDATRASWRLDELLGQQLSLIQNGAGLQTNLTDYIRGRDEFLNQTDSMLTKLRNDMTNIDTSNPQTAASYAKQGEYLYQLRGRQSQRYVDFVNTSIEQYNGRITAMENLTKTALDGYTRDLTTKQAITQEEYNTMFSALSDMYTQTANAPLLAAQMETERQKQYASYVSAAKDMAALEDLTNPSLLKIKKDLTTVGVLDDYGRWNPNSYTADNVSTDPLTSWKILSDSIDPTFSNTTIGYNKVTGEPIDTTLDATTKEKVAKSMISQVEDWITNGNIPQDAGMQTISEIKGKIASSQFGTIGADKAKPIEDAIWRLTNPEAGTSWYNGWFSNKFIGSGGKTPTKAKFLEEQKNSGLPTNYLNTLYDDYTEYIASGGDNATFSSSYLGNNLTSGVNSLAKSYTDKLFSTKTY